MLKKLVVLTRYVTCIAAALTLTACAAPFTYKSQLATKEGPKTIAVFFDGTHNDVASDTNVKRLHSLVSLQARPDMATLYVEGVGTGQDVLGMALGVGFRARVIFAYEWILNNYSPNDKIYIFGFSRGAYAGRALTSLLYHAGLPAAEGTDHALLAASVYDAVHGAPADDTQSRRDRVKEELGKQGILAGAPVAVEVLGLWDTVQALGNPRWDRHFLHKTGIRPMPVNVDIPNQNHGDQLCNVRHAYQALSIDDNREWVFTPLLLSRKALYANCPMPADDDFILDQQGRIKPGRVQEVWFSGAHSDVGGGYGDSALSGVSLNWMIGQVRDLVPPGTVVREDWYGTTHNPESGWFSVTYHDMRRNLGAYVSDATRHRPEFLGSLCVHESVLGRRKALELKGYENHQISLRTAGPVRLTDDTSEGFADPPRLKECSEQGSPEQCKTTIEVQVWPKCKGGPEA